MRYTRMMSALLFLIGLATAAMSLNACERKMEGPEFDTGLTVIVDENMESNGAGVDISALRISLVAKEEMGTVSYSVGEGAVVFSANAAPGYSFVGWYTSDDYSGQMLSSEANYRASALKLSGIVQNQAVILYARFERQYNIVYDLGVGSFVGATPSLTYTPSNEAQPLAENVANENCRFVGWRLSQTGLTVAELPAGVEGDITLTAVWDDVTEAENIFKNTVWDIVDNDYSVNAIFVFNPGGVLDIFSYNGDEQRPYIHVGALTRLRYEFEHLFENTNEIQTGRLMDLSYDCSGVYYRYELTATGCEIIPIVELASSQYLNLVRLIIGDVRFFLEKRDDGSLEFMVRQPSSVTYEGVSYSRDRWVQFVASNMSGTLPDSSAVTYEYETVSLNLNLTKVADEVTDYVFNAFTPQDTLKDSLALGKEYMIEGSHIVLEKTDDDRYGYAKAAFQRGDDVYTAFIYMDMIEINLTTVRYWSTSELEPYTPPAMIEKYEGRF